MREFRLEAIDAERIASARRYQEFLREESMSLGLYVLRAGEADPQKPHGEDEAYCILRGRGKFTAGGRTVDATPGVVLFVPAQEEHRFHDVTEDLAILVAFAPPEGST